MSFVIPIVAALLFRAGGTDQWPWCPLKQKWWRWLTGVFVGLLLWKGWLLYGLTVGAYLLATNLFGYGDKTPILKYLPQNIKHLVSGMFYGACAFVLLPWWLALPQTALSGIVFYVVETRKINNPWAELYRGGWGTILYLVYSILYVLKLAF